MMTPKFIFLMALGILPRLSVADIPDDFRRDNAVVHYDFAETTGPVMDSAHSKFGSPLNLEIFFPGAVLRQNGSIELREAGVIRSLGPATKVTQACMKSGAMTLEVELENNESVELRSGNDSSRRIQPLRIVSLSKSLFERNFILGQFYDMGNFLAVASRTERNESTPENMGNSLRDPFSTKVSSTFVPKTDSPATVKQTLIWTLGSSGVSRIYLTDRNGSMYLAENATIGFGSGSPATYFSNWFQDAHLALGNEPISREDYSRWAPLNTSFAGCNRARSATDQCYVNPNRFWKGKLHRVAIYCQELSRAQILGEGVENIKKNAAVEVGNQAVASPTRQKAAEIYTRITGLKVPLTHPKVEAMDSLVASGDLVAAAALATEESAFLNITVRDFASKMSNRDETINVPLNDFTATVVGFVRDGVSAKKLLTENIVYKADPKKAPVPSDWVDDLLKSNNHYEALGQGQYDLGKVLEPTTQKLFDGTTAVENQYAAGLLTTRQWMAAHAIAGTNRRPVEYAFRQFACRPLENLADAGGPDDVVGRDIDRFPGGVHAKYVTTCRACHTIMDGFRPAFAAWTFSNGFAKNGFVVKELTDPDADENTSNAMRMNPRHIAIKMNHNENVFNKGRVTENEEWTNNANRGANITMFKWTRLSGKGVRDFGAAMAESATFPRCMAERVFKQVCRRAPASQDEGMLNKVASEFSKEKAYNLKYLFQKIVTTEECLGGGSQ